MQRSGRTAPLNLLTVTAMSRASASRLPETDFSHSAKGFCVRAEVELSDLTASQLRQLAQVLCDSVNAEHGMRANEALIKSNGA